MAKIDETLSMDGKGHVLHMTSIIPVDAYRREKPGHQ